VLGFGGGLSLHEQDFGLLDIIDVVRTELRIGEDRLGVEVADLVVKFESGRMMSVK